MIKDILVLKTPRFSDDRGSLTQLFNSKEDLPDIKRMYIVSNFNKDTIRAYHKNIDEWKYFFVIKGAVKFVLVDDRDDSETFKEKQVIVLSEDNPSLIGIPPGVYNGWKALIENSILLGTADRTIAKHKDERVPPTSFGNVLETKNR